jgi:HEAT repeat protein
VTIPADALDALSHPEDSDRCVRAVQRCQAERLVAAAPHVIRLLEGGADEWLVAACAEALGALGVSDAVVPLRQALDVRLDALERPFEDAEVAPEQIGQWAVAVGQERAEISDAAVAIARALGQLGDPRAAASLARGAASERVDARLRDACGAARRGAPAAGAGAPVARAPTSVEPESAPETAADFLALATQRERLPHDGGDGPS